MLRRLLLLWIRIAEWVVASWIWVLGSLFGAAVLILGLVAWEMAGEPVDDTQEALAQLQALFTTVQAALAVTVGMATIYQARATARTHKRMEARDEANKRRDRIGIAHAFVGSAIETAGPCRISWRAPAHRAEDLEGLLSRR
jgi:hypothetical protein